MVIAAEKQTYSEAATGLYPAYMSMDEFVDVEALRSLDSYIMQRVKKHILQDSDPLFLNQHRLEADSPYEPGVREVWLRRTVPGTPYDYLDVDKPELWEYTEAASEFTLLVDFLKGLPFSEFGRMLMIYDDGGRTVPAHRDHEATDICHEFIWMRTNKRKPFYVLNQFTGEKKYIEGYTAWFDTVNQFHGSDAGDGLTFSIRVDGRFTNEFRNQIPFDRENPASTPAVWAASVGGEA
jgi:hypothetical protein